MSSLFESTQRESAVDIVVNSIKQLLIEGKLKPGDRMPNEQEIADGLKVSRGSVREAMKILSAFGLIDIKVGNGTYICEKPGNKMMDSLLFSYFAANPDLNDLYEFRNMFECGLVELIVRHYDENAEERSALKKNVAQLENLIKSRSSAEERYQNDMEFHKLLGAASLNPLVTQTYNAILEFMDLSIRATHKAQDGSEAYRVHKDILDLIERRDYANINKVVGNSVELWYNLENTAVNEAEMKSL